jgi:hypothetical protein
LYTLFFVLSSLKTTLTGLSHSRPSFPICNANVMSLHWIVIFSSVLISSVLFINTS